MSLKCWIGKQYKFKDFYYFNYSDNTNVRFFLSIYADEIYGRI